MFVGLKLSLGFFFGGGSLGVVGFMFLKISLGFRGQFRSCRIYGLSLGFRGFKAQFEGLSLLNSNNPSHLDAISGPKP